MHCSRTWIVGLSLLGSCAVSTIAMADDAVDELKQGYALKQAGNCRDAIPHFVRSFDLDPTPKALLNRSDCEARIGDLVAAQRDAAQGSELARRQGDPRLADFADKQYEAIKVRLPRLTISLADGAPPGTTVLRDGVPIDVGTLDVAVGVNPGTHQIVVTAPGYLERRFDVLVREGARERERVLPGPTIAAERSFAKRPEPPPKAAEPGHNERADWLTYSALGVGAAGLVIGSVLALVSKSTYDHALSSECGVAGGFADPKTCNQSGYNDVQSAQGQATAATVAFVAGAALIGGGAYLYLSAPKGSGRDLSVVGAVGAGSAGLTLRGRW